MTAARMIYHGGPVFDGTALHDGWAVSVADGVIDRIGPDTGQDGTRIDLGGDILAPGYVDLQVNGGGGVMFNDDQSVQTLRSIAAAHRILGATSILPTLITDTPDRTTRAIDAAAEAIAQGVPGIAGLHLEGPHLSVARKGAHDPDLIRPMTDTDLALYLGAADKLPALMMTIAPENTCPDQVAALTRAGAILSLGHSDADHATCLTYADAGATCVTHLFNAMSQLGNRAPGLVGAALDAPGLAAGLIADGIHVHPATIAAALRAKRGPAPVFLVSDAMAPAGTNQTTFVLNGRPVTRTKGRLTLGDGTLAGADLDLTTAIRVLVQKVDVPLAQALAMATSLPARVARLPRGTGALMPGTRADLIRINAALNGVEVLA